MVTRGHRVDPFGDRVQRIVADRNDLTSLTTSIPNQSWDIVFDFIGFNARNAANLCIVLKNRTKRLIFISSQSVYDAGANISETACDTHNLNLDIEYDAPVDYQLGKRHAEAVYFQQGDFETTSVRFPIILGPDDYTKRLHYHVERISKGQEIYFPSLNSRISFISSHDAASLLGWLVLHPTAGSINACSPEPISLSALIGLIENSVGKKAVLVHKPSDSNHSSFGISADWYMSSAKIQNKGFNFTPLNSWLPDLIKQIYQSL
jgi:nucleoside-diphosphate-sugar epimerase